MEQRVEHFIRGLNNIVKVHHCQTGFEYEICFRESKRYFKILYRSFYYYYLQRSFVIGFIDKTDGNFLEAKSVHSPSSKILTNVKLLDCGLEKVTYDGNQIKFLGI